MATTWEKSGDGDLFTKSPLEPAFGSDLDDFNLLSPEASQVRRALRKGQERDYRVSVIAQDQRKNHPQIKELFNKWRQSKPPLQLKFFLSSPFGNHLVDEYEKWFMVERAGKGLAFCSLLPYLRNAELGFYLDHLIYDPEKEPHALSYLISFLIELLKMESVSEFNLGLNPFARVDRTHWMGRFFDLLYHIPFFYKPKGLHFFKKKFTGTEQREYCFFQHRRGQWRGLADMAKVTVTNFGVDDSIQ